MLKFHVFSRVAPVLLGTLVLFAARTSAAIMGESSFSDYRKLASGGTSPVRIAGTLSCQAETRGDNCMLQVRDAKSGKEYALDNADSAKELFSRGTTQVMIEGSFIEKDKFRVSRSVPN